MTCDFNGLCVGSGLLVASLCDIRICGESSRVGVPVKNFGLVEAYAEMEPVVRLARADVALEILLEGRIFGTAKAQEMRLVTRIDPDAQVEAEVQASAQRIAEGEVPHRLGGASRETEAGLRRSLTRLRRTRAD